MKVRVKATQGGTQYSGVVDVSTGDARVARDALATRLGIDALTLTVQSVEIV